MYPTKINYNIPKMCLLVGNLNPPKEFPQWDNTINCVYFTNQSSKDSSSPSRAKMELNQYTLEIKKWVQNNRPMGGGGGRGRLVYYSQ